MLERACAKNSQKPSRVVSFWRKFFILQEATFLKLMNNTHSGVHNVKRANLEKTEMRMDTLTQPTPHQKVDLSGERTFYLHTVSHNCAKNRIHPRFPLPFISELGSHLHCFGRVMSEDLMSANEERLTEIHKAQQETPPPSFLKRTLVSAAKNHVWNELAHEQLCIGRRTLVLLPIRGGSLDVTLERCIKTDCRGARLDRQKGRVSGGAREIDFPHAEREQDEGQGRISCTLAQVKPAPHLWFTKSDKNICTQLPVCLVQCEFAVGTEGTRRFPLCLLLGCQLCDAAKTKLKHFGHCVKDSTWKGILSNISFLRVCGKFKDVTA